MAVFEAKVGRHPNLEVIVMVRRAEPIDINVAKGKSHRGKAEIEARREAEAALTFKDDDLDPPKWLKVKAKRIYIERAELLKALNTETFKMFTNADVPALAVYADAYARYQTEPDPRIRKQLFDIFSKIGCEFGFMPQSRAKLAIPKKPKKKKSKFEKEFGNV